MTIFECWVSLDEDEVTILTSDHPQHTWHTENHQHSYSIRADSLEEALEEHHKIQGWEPYKRMEPEERN